MACFELGDISLSLGYKPGALIDVEVGPMVLQVAEPSPAPFELGGADSFGVGSSTS